MVSGENLISGILPKKTVRTLPVSSGIRADGERRDPRRHPAVGYEARGDGEWSRDRRQCHPVEEK
jgi:hypothetical protein